jgi:Ca2+-binding RTX toxin-like protein
MATVYGTNNGEIIDGLNGVTNSADTIYGFDGVDWIYGLGGNDVIKGGGGADAIYGGSGIDTAEYSDSTQAVIVSLLSNTGVGGAAEGDILNSIENLTGSAHADTLIGNDGINVLSGGNGEDSLKGGGGADTLNGDNGNDILKGGGGADTLNGGAGIDTANYAESAAAVTVSLLSDTASGGDAQGDELNAIENLTGSAHNDTLWGDDGVNVLSGGDGNDQLKGFGGADTLNGGNGNDSLNGGTGADQMNGGEGADTFYVDNAGDTISDASSGTFDVVYTTTSYTLSAGADIELFRTSDAASTAGIALTGNASSQEIIGNAGANAINGGLGNDILTGLGGDDSFIFSTALGASNIDTITDYALNDLVALDDAIFGGLSTTGTGHLAANNFRIGAGALDADDRIIYNSATGTLSYDADGNGAGAAIHFANIGVGLALTSDEFLVI